MLRPLLLLLAVLASLFVVCSPAAAQPAPAAEKMSTLTIMVDVPPGTGTVYLTGSVPELGPWHTDKFAMQGDGTRRTASLKVADGTTVMFKFCLGSWENQAMPENGGAPDNNYVLVSGDTTRSYTVTSFGDPTDTRKVLTLDVTVPEGTGDVYLTGSLPELGPWEPMKFKLSGEGTTRSATLRVEQGTKVELKLTGGAWDLEALNADSSVPGNTVIEVKNTMTYQWSVPKFRQPAVELPWPDPARWEKQIAAFEERDKEAMPPAGAIVATGSSSMVGWHGTIKRDLAPLTIIPRGFGGSNYNDLHAMLDRVVVPYKPRAVLIYEGDNDIAGGMFPESVIAKFKETTSAIRQWLPQARIYILAVKPSPSREKFWPDAVKVNEAMKAACDADPMMTYIDIATPMLGPDGKARVELFGNDMLHMNESGYALWTTIVKPVLLEGEAAYETKATAP